MNSRRVDRVAVTGVGVLTWLGRGLTRHADALASNAQAQPLLAQAMTGGALGSSCLGEGLGPGVSAVDDHRRFGLNPSGGLLRIIAALLRLQAEPGPRRALIHGLALSGGQTVTTVEQVAQSGPRSS